MHLIRLLVDLRHALPKLQLLVLRADLPFLVQLIRQIIQHPGILINHRIYHPLRIYHALSGDKPEVLKMLKLLFSHRRHVSTAPCIINDSWRKMMPLS